MLSIQTTAIKYIHTWRPFTAKYSTCANVFFEALKEQWNDLLIESFFDQSNLFDDGVSIVYVGI